LFGPDGAVCHEIPQGLKAAAAGAPMFKNAVLFAAMALILGLSAPSLFLESGARIVARAPPKPTVAAPVAPAAAEAGAEIDSGFRQASIAADAAGQYRASARIEGQEVDVLVDTGASVVAITAETAERLGVVADPYAPKWRMNTANGVTVASPVMLRSVSLGSIEMTDVQAVIMPPGASASNLLGASFLKRLASVEQRDSVLLLKQ
jgi:aspartyl protease family protein